MLLVGGLGAIFIALGLGIAILVDGRRTSAVERVIATIGQAYSPVPTAAGTAGAPASAPCRIRHTPKPLAVREHSATMSR